MEMSHGAAVGLKRLGKSKWIAVARTVGTCLAAAEDSLFVAGVDFERINWASRAESQKNFAGYAPGAKFYPAATPLDVATHKLAEHDGFDERRGREPEPSSYRDNLVEKVDGYLANAAAGGNPSWTAY
jgi:hypothetical protein